MIPRYREPVSDWPRHDIQLLTRTSWTDARTALRQIKKGRASGRSAPLRLRARLQGQLLQLGRFVDRNAGKVLFVGLLAMATFCVGLKSAVLETDIHKLWVQQGGRLERELSYVRATLGEGAGSSSQIVIQAAPGTDLLRPDALLAHLDALRRAILVSVDMFDVTWRLKDLCYAPSFPSFEEHYIDSMLENLFPCAIITPLDCFWEGSKLLGPDLPVSIPGLGLSVQWSNLNPQQLVADLKDMGAAFPFPIDSFKDFMKRAGITTGYQEKPCLNPADEHCPGTASNRRSQRPPDVGAELTGGCYGFSTKYMHWPEDLVVGGVQKNRSGHIVRAEALQSVVQLMGEKDMYHFWKGHNQMLHLDWSVDKARAVLEAWQRKFAREVQSWAESRNSTRGSRLHVFTAAALSDMMKNFSEVGPVKLGLGVVLMVLYTCGALWRPADSVGSQSGLGLCGVLLSAAASAAGLGLCALAGLDFNASTTQVLPFLSLGLGLDNVFLLAYAYAQCARDGVPLQALTGETLKRAGPGVLLASCGVGVALLAAALVPVPALRTFALQAALLHAFAAAASLLLFPAALALDARRRRSKRVDLLCCVRAGDNAEDEEREYGSEPKATSKRRAVAKALPPDQSHVITVLGPTLGRAPGPLETWVRSASERAHATALAGRGKGEGQGADLLLKKNLEAPSTENRWERWTLTHFATVYYAPFVQRTPVKVLSVLGLVALLGGSAWGAVRTGEGPDLSDVVPVGSRERAFLQAQARYFGFFHMFAVTRGGFEYPTKQRLLLDYHEAFTRVPHIIKNDDGGLPDFWLTLFRDWLLGLQEAFDKDWRGGCITQEQWFANASDEGVLAYKLLVQTGRADYPVDKTLVLRGRLVDAEGVVNPRGFYNYLSAWASNDALAYSASQANLRPEPRQWLHSRHDVELRVPKSPPLVYAQMPFYLRGLRHGGDVTEAVTAVREICTRFEALGLPNFPSGVPFTFWEQYLGLKTHLLVALGLALIAVFVVVATVLLNPWAALLLVAVLASMVLELFGTMGFLGVRLSAVPSVVLVVSVGIGVQFTAHITVGFLTSVGSRNRRVALALEHTFAPVVHGAASTLLGVAMLAFSEFDFVVRHFFYVLSALVGIGLLNGLLLLPVLLSLVGPPGEVVPNRDPERLDTPSPEPSPEPSPRPRPRPPASSRGDRPRFEEAGGLGASRRCAPWSESLSTISEEPPSYHSCSSHEIVVHPEVVVETTTVTNSGGGHADAANAKVEAETQSGPQNNRSPTPSTGGTATPEGSGGPTVVHTTTDRSSGNTTNVTTKVTAKVKVAVHAPVHGSERSHKHRRRRDSFSSS